MSLKICKILNLNFFEKINPFLLSYMSENSIDLLIEKKHIYW